MNAQSTDQEFQLAAPPHPPSLFLSYFSNTWEHTAYVWRAALIIHAGSQFECGGEVVLVWKRMVSRDLKKGSELSFFFFYGSAPFV